MSSSLAAGLSPARQALANGAVIIAQEAPATRSVAISAEFLAGSLYEPDNLPGLAYLTSRVIDRGTTRRSAEAIAEELDARGVSLKIAATRHTITFSSTCLAEDFDDVLDIIVDVARCPTFPDTEVAKRRAESITAIRQDDDNPAVQAVETLSEMLYGAAHPYGRRIKGSVDSLERISRDAIWRFHTRYVRPAVLSLVIVGNVPAARAIDRAGAALEGWIGAPERPVVVPPPLVAPARRVREISMAGKSQTDIAYGFTAVSRLDPRYYAYWMMNNILGQFGLGGRLADNIRERQGMAYYAFSSFDATVGEGPLVIRAGVDPANVQRTIEAIDAEVRALGDQGPTATEMDETRGYLLGSIPRLLETNYSIARFLQSAERFGLGLDFDRRLPALIDAVTIDDVRRAAQAVLRPDRAAIAIAGPDLSGGAES